MKENQSKLVKLNLLLADGSIDNICAISNEYEKDSIIYFGTCDKLIYLNKIVNKKQGIYIIETENEIKVFLGEDIEFNVFSVKNNKFYYLTNSKILTDKNKKMYVRDGISINLNLLKYNNAKINDQFIIAELNSIINNFLLLLKLIAATLFCNYTKKENKIKNKSINLDRKKDVINYLKSKNCSYLIRDNTTYASLNRVVNIYWANPDINVINNDWCLILNNYITKKIYVLLIPAHTLNGGYKSKSNMLLLRNDPSKKNVYDIKINGNTFIEERSNLDFRIFIKEEYNY